MPLAAANEMNDSFTDDVVASRGPQSRRERKVTEITPCQHLTHDDHEAIAAMRALMKRIA